VYRRRFRPGDGPNPDSISAYLDGKLLRSDRTDYRTLVQDQNWFSLKDNSVLGVACDEPVTFYRLYLVEVTGRGKRLR
jgi:hypothetical protein